MCTIAIEALTALSRASCIKLYKNITRSRLFCRIAKRSIHKKLLRAISPKIGNFARAIKSSRDHVCASADAIASDRSRKTKRPAVAAFFVVSN